MQDYDHTHKFWLVVLFTNALTNVANVIVGRSVVRSFVRFLYFVVSPLTAIVVIEAIVTGSLESGGGDLVYVYGQYTCTTFKVRWGCQTILSKKKRNVCFDGTLGSHSDDHLVIDPNATTHRLTLIYSSIVSSLHIILLVTMASL